MDNKKMAQFISELRKGRHLTQKELAEQLGVTDKAVSKWERGLSCPDISLLSELSQILGVTTNELLNGEKAGPSAPEADSIAQPTLDYSDPVTKSNMAIGTVWKTIAVVLLGILVMIGCNLAIDKGLAWSMLPAGVVGGAWIIATLGVFVVGKNKIASLLLCGLFIFVTTFYYSSLNQATARDISAYGAFDGFQKAYIPHYTIILLLFMVSIIVAGASFSIQNKKISGDTGFVLVAASITVIILTEITLPAIMDYVDIHGLGVNPTFTVLSLLTFLMNCVSLAMLARRHRKQIAGNQKIGT